MLSAVAVFETDNDHPVATETLAPAVDSVFFGDANRDVEFVVACHADVVVAGVAFETVVARV